MILLIRDILGELQEGFTLISFSPLELGWLTVWKMQLFLIHGYFYINSKYIHHGIAYKTKNWNKMKYQIIGDWLKITVQLSGKIFYTHLEYCSRR